MAVTWTIERDVVNTATELSKVVATRMDTVAGTTQSFFTKGRMKTLEEQKNVTDDIWAQYQAAKTKAETIDPVADKMSTDLESKEPAP